VFDRSDERRDQSVAQRLLEQDEEDQERDRADEQPEAHLGAHDFLPGDQARAPPEGGLRRSARPVAGRAGVGAARPRRPDRRSQHGRAEPARSPRALLFGRVRRRSVAKDGDHCTSRVLADVRAISVLNVEVGDSSPLTSTQRAW
jgi:hypothetical protein